MFTINQKLASAAISIGLSAFAFNIFAAGVGTSIAPEDSVRLASHVAIDGKQV